MKVRSKKIYEEIVKKEVKWVKIRIIEWMEIIWRYWMKIFKKLKKRIRSKDLIEEIRRRGMNVGNLNKKLNVRDVIM